MSTRILPAQHPSTHPVGIRSAQICPDVYQDACGQWKKFRCRVDEKPVCLTAFHLGTTEIQISQVFGKAPCEEFKLVDASVTEDKCRLLLLKPGCYEFCPVSATGDELDNFPKMFRWEKTELTYEGVNTIVNLGGVARVM